jgi:hypothetical protein
LLHTGPTIPSLSGRPSNSEPVRPPSIQSCYNSQLIFRNNSYRKFNESPLTFTRIPLKLYWKFLYLHCSVLWNGLRWISDVIWKLICPEHTC